MHPVSKPQMKKFTKKRFMYRFRSIMTDTIRNYKRDRVIAQCLRSGCLHEKYAQMSPVIATSFINNSHLIFSCSFSSSICLTSSTFSDDRAHQLQKSMRHTKSNATTKRGGHLPPPTLIPSIPITFRVDVAFARCHSRRDICHVIAAAAVVLVVDAGPLGRRVSCVGGMQTICLRITRAFSLQHQPHVTQLHAAVFPRDRDERFIEKRLRTRGGWRW